MRTIKNVLVLVICIFITMQSYSQLLVNAPHEIKKYAVDFLKKKLSDKISVNDLEAVYASDMSAKNRVYYLKNINGGFVTVASDGEKTKVVAYSLTGDYKFDKEHPVFKSVSTSFENAQLLKTKPKTSLKSGIGSVSALLDAAGIHWNQTEYYNAGAPYDSDYGRNSYAGCVAVAMGQVMRYHKHPKTGRGVYSYTHDKFGELSVDYENSTYNWDNMPGDLTDHNSDVAQFLYHCGVAVNMEYKATAPGSGAYIWAVDRAMRQNFRYENAQILDDGFFPGHEWDELLRDELKNGRPVFAEVKASPGHAVVIDGYNEDGFFHFNWGWGGQEDGMYNISELAWAGGTQYGLRGKGLIGASSDPLVPCNEQDSLALVALYNSTNGANWKSKINWLSGRVMDWEGVIVLNSRVTHVMLGDNNLVGELPVELGNLDKLRWLTLGKNKITNIPKELGNLKELKRFIIYSNEVEEIPVELYDATNLVILNLSFNKIKNIPDGINKLSKLASLDVSYNQLEGSVQSQIWDLPNLEILSIMHNKLTGSLPNDFSKFQKLVFFEFYNNQLSGNIPVSMFDLPYLRYIYGSNNKFTGTLSMNSGLNSVVEKLNLSNNNIDAISENISELDSLKQFGLAFNKIKNLPVGLGNMYKLEELDLEHNDMADTLSSAVCNIETLKTLNVGNNELSFLPENIGDLANLTYLALDSNKVEYIPESIGDLRKVTNFYASNNQIYDIPYTIYKMESLIAVDFSHNALTSVNQGISYMQHLIDLNVSHNRINTDLPPLNHLKDLNMLSINHNALNFKNISTSGIQLHKFKGTYFWSYQDTIKLSKKVFEYNDGDSVRIDIKEISNLSHPNNVYLWFKGNDYVTDGVLQFDEMSSDISGEYRCIIENDSVNYHLDLESEPITIRYPQSDSFDADTIISVSNKVLTLYDDTVTLSLDADVRGTTKWQTTVDSVNWKTLDDSETDGVLDILSEGESDVKIKPKKQALYRLEVSEENCSPLYSDTLSIEPLNMFIDTTINVSESPITITKNNVEIIVPHNFYDKEFRLTVNKLKTPPSAPDTVKLGDVYDINVSFGETFKLPLIIKLKMPKETEASKLVGNTNAVYFDDKNQEWKVYEEASVSVKDSSIVFETEHLTKVGWWEYLSETGAYTHKYEYNNVTVYYSLKDYSEDFYRLVYNFKQGVQPWHLTEGDAEYGTPMYIQDVAYYTWKVREKIKSEELLCPDKFTVYCTRLSKSDGEVGLWAMMNGYIVIDRKQNPWDLRSLVAHEYWHYTQDYYITAHPGNIFWMEATANLTDRLVWDETVIPFTESEQYLFNNLAGKYSFFNTLSWSWDAWDYSFLTQNNFGSLNYCYQAGVFLHYMRSYRTGTKLDPTDLLKYSPPTGSWKDYLNTFIKTKFNSTIGDEYDDFVKHILSGKNSYLTLMPKGKNPDYDVLRYINGAPQQFLKKKFYTFKDTDDQSEKRIEDNIKLYLPHLSSQMVEITNINENDLLYVKLKPKHIKDTDIKAYVCTFNDSDKTMDIKDISVEDSTMTTIDIRNEKNIKNHKCRRYLLFVNKSKDKAKSIEYDLEITGIINFDILTFAEFAVGMNNDIKIHEYDDGQKRKFEIAAPYNVLESKVLGDSVITATSKSKSGDMTMVCEYNFLSNRYKITTSHSSVSSTYVYDSQTGTMVLATNTVTDNKTLEFKNIQLNFSTAGFSKYVGDSKDLTDTKNTVINIDHYYKSVWSYPSGREEVEEYEYANTDWNTDSGLRLHVELK